MICALALAVASHGHSSTPRWLDKELAGYLLLDDEKHRSLCVFDRQSGFFLERDGECDGGILWVTLTRDRKLISREGYAIPGFNPNPEDNSPGTRALALRSLPSLKTGKGVRIDDSPTDVEHILGAPQKIKRSGSRRQFLDYVYKWSEGKGDLDAEYAETYTFKAGKLIEIHFLRALNAA